MNKYSFGSITLRVLAFAILAILVFHENADVSDRTEDCSGREDSSNELHSFDYGLLLHLSTYKDPNDESVRVITLTSGIEPDDILTNVCRQRLFLAKLIHKLNASRVSEIVLDKRYSPSACPQDKAWSDAFVSSVAQSGARVVIGLDAALLRQAKVEPVGTRRVCIQARPHLQLPNAYFGLIRLDRDTRRAPLEWPAVPEDGSAARLLPTLSFEAAQQANPDILTRRRLNRILASGRQPFSGFNSQSINQYSALQLLCGSAATSDTSWEMCSEEPTPETRDLSGKIAVIGDHTDGDRHESISGVSYGVDLQANYIASILADDLYIPLFDNVSSAIFTVAWFVLVQIVFFLDHRLLRAFAICMAVWLVVFLAGLFLLAFGGYLLTFWFQGINLTIIGLTWAEHWIHRLQFTPSHKA